MGPGHVAMSLSVEGKILPKPQDCCEHLEHTLLGGTFFFSHQIVDKDIADALGVSGQGILRQRSRKGGVE